MNEKTPELPSCLQYDMSAGVCVRRAWSSVVKDDQRERSYSTTAGSSFDELTGVQQPSDLLTWGRAVMTSLLKIYILLKKKLLIKHEH